MIDFSRGLNTIWRSPIEFDYELVIDFDYELVLGRNKLIIFLGRNKLIIFFLCI